MKNILLIGAGRSASTLIKYLLDNSSKENWKITVADLSVELAQQKTNNHPNSHAIALDITNEQQRANEISKVDLVISMLPATMHLPVAKECLKQKKNMVTASYVSKQMHDLNDEAKKAGVIFLNEMGLDPGIDHLSAMKVIDEVHAQGGTMVTFRSYCGGLVAPESNDNPWGYKFTWNPRAVVMAGQSGDSAGATAQYLENGKVKYVPYTRLFTNAHTIFVDSPPYPPEGGNTRGGFSESPLRGGGGAFEAYANRDSLLYIDLYGLHDVKNMLRGTLRMPGFCRAWNAFIQLGLTDDNCKVSNSEKISYAELIESFLPEGKGGVKKKMARFLKEKDNSPVMKKLDWLGIFKNQKIGLKDSSPAEILLDLLMKKWRLKPRDKDMVVMQHVFEYTSPKSQVPSFKKTAKRKVQRLTSSMVVIGEDQINTAMSKTVGLPLGIATKLILEGKINLTGVWIPTVKEIYNPVLAELEKYGITFVEKHS
ncbi:MAG: saccharopine dehydrogenase NADP-binding domain-containing protein [Bacteroidetes bacterium]|nr:saccharopine dehydrogenase NADP-binding domain-containing protein [Bacteroidota bacterium]